MAGHGTARHARMRERRIGDRRPVQQALDLARPGMWNGRPSPNRPPPVGRSAPALPADGPQGKPQEAVAPVAVPLEAAGQAKPPGPAEPRAAARDAPIIALALRSAWVVAIRTIARSLAVGAPLPDLVVHFVQTPRVDRKPLHRHDRLPVLALRAVRARMLAIVLRLPRVARLAETERRRRSGPPGGEPMRNSPGPSQRWRSTTPAIVTSR